MKHLIIAGSVAAILLATSGCSGSTASASPTSFLAENNSRVVFIHWTKSGDRLHGTITEDTVGGSGSAQTLSVNSAPFTGTMSGNSVNLTFGSLYFLHTGAHGTLGGSVLTMAVPQSDGTAQQTNLSQSGKAAYDRAAARLNSNITHANLLAASQQASRGPQSPRGQAEHSAQIALTTLYRDASLAAGSRLADSMARFEYHIHAAGSHLAAEKSKAALGDNKHCSTAYAVTGDALAVNGASLAVQGDITAMTAAITTVRYDIATAEARLRHLTRAGVSAPSQASRVIATANTDMKQAIFGANSYISQINAIDTRAKSVADNMASGKCSDARSGSLVVRPIAPLR